MKQYIPTTKLAAAVATGVSVLAASGARADDFDASAAITALGTTAGTYGAAALGLATIVVSIVIGIKWFKKFANKGS